RAHLLRAARPLCARQHVRRHQQDVEFAGRATHGPSPSTSSDGPLGSTRSTTLLDELDRGCACALELSIGNTAGQRGAALSARLALLDGTCELDAVGDAELAEDVAQVRLQWESIRV